MEDNVKVVGIFSVAAKNLLFQHKNDDDDFDDDTYKYQSAVSLLVME